MLGSKIISWISDFIGFIGFGGCVAIAFFAINTVIRKRLFLSQVLSLRSRAGIKNWSKKFSIYQKPTLTVNNEDYSYSKFIKEIIKNESFIIIHSPSGYGKSMLMLKLAYACSKRFIIKKINSDRDMGLLYIKIDSEKTLEESIISQLKNLQNICVFIDGFDELSDFSSGSFNPSGALERIINLCSSNDAKKLVISFRSEIFADRISFLPKYMLNPNEPSRVVVSEIKRFSNKDVIRTYRKYASETELCKISDFEKSGVRKLTRSETKAIENRLSDFLNKNNDSLFSIPLFIPWIPMIFTKHKSNSDISALSRFDILKEITEDFFTREYRIKEAHIAYTDNCSEHLLKSRKVLCEIVKTMNPDDEIAFTGKSITTDTLAQVIDVDDASANRYAGKYLFRYIESDDRNPEFEFLHSSFYEFYLCVMIVDTIKNCEEYEVLKNYSDFISEIPETRKQFKELYYEAVYSEIRSYTDIADYREFLDSSEKIMLNNCPLKLDRIVLMLPCLEEINYNGIELGEEEISSALERELIVDTGSTDYRRLIGCFSDGYINSVSVLNRDFINDSSFNDILETVRPSSIKVYTDNRETFSKLLGLGIKEIYIGLSDYSELYIDIYNYIKGDNQNTEIRLIKASEYRDDNNNIELLRAIFLLDYINFQCRDENNIHKALVLISGKLLFEITESRRLDFIAPIEAEIDDFVELFDKAETAPDFRKTEYLFYHYGIIKFLEEKYHISLPYLQVSYEWHLKNNFKNSIDNRRYWYGCCLFAIEDYVSALPLLKESYECGLKDNISEDVINNRRYWYGLCLYKTKDYVSALPLLKESYECGLKDNISEDAINNRRYWYGCCLFAIEDFVSALPLLKTTYEWYLMNRSEADINATRSWYGRCLFYTKDYAAALPLFRESYERNINNNNSESPINEAGSYYYGMCLLKTQKYETALPFLKESYEWCLKDSAENIINDRRYWYALCLYETGDYAAALPLTEESYLWSLSSPLASDNYKSANKKLFVDCLRAVGRNEEADRIENEG